MPGPAPKPRNELHSWRADLVDESTAIQGHGFARVPPVPNYLKANARAGKLWKRLAKEFIAMNILCQSDLHLLGRLVLLYILIEDVSEKLATASGDFDENLKRMQILSTEARQLEKALSCSPKARIGAQSTIAETQKNKADTVKSELLD